MKSNAMSVLTQSENKASAYSLNKFFSEIPEDVLRSLEIAHSRYEHLIDITSGVFSCEEVDEDRRNHPEFLKMDGKKPLFSDDDCVLFMSEKYNLPKLLCRMYIANDFNWTIKSGFAEEEQKELLSRTKNNLIRFFKDEDVDEINDFLNCRVGF